MNGRTALVCTASCALLVAALATLPANAQSFTTRGIVPSATTNIQPTPQGSDALQSPEFDPSLVDPDLGSLSGGGMVNRSIAVGPGAGLSASSGKKAKSNPQLVLSFDGLNHRNQRLANGGNQFSLEPPDQGLCVGNGFVLETVNDVLRVYDTSGNALVGVTDLNTFYGYPPAIVRPSTFGPEITDPSCFFDSDTQRWFHVALTLYRKGTTSAFAGPNHLDLAVSQTSSPLGSWNIYSIPVQDDGTEGTPNHQCAGGPCLGDYPHMGADANGIYLTTNQFNFFSPGFHGSQVYAISKQALAAGLPITVIQFDTADPSLLLDGNPGFTMWPATTPAGAYADDLGGTEYLLSSVAVFKDSRSDNRLRIWALSNTQSLNTNPAVTLNAGVANVETYAVPPKSGQKAGDFPLGQCLADSTISTPFGPGCWRFLFSSGGPFNEVESQHVDSNDSRMQQVVFANGNLWGALDTALSIGGASQAGIAYFVIVPQISSSAVGGQVRIQGYLGLANNNLTYPAVGVNASGRGAIAFTLLGVDNFPSAAYASLDALVGVGDIHVAAAGLGPEDGFTAYKAYVGNTRNRWGDYGATAVDGNSMWIASEYIGQTCTLTQYLGPPFGSCDGTRTALGNWGTRISHIVF